MKVGEDIQEYEKIYGVRIEEETTVVDEQSATVVCVIGPDSRRHYVRSEVSIAFSKTCDHEICFCSNHADF